MAKFGVDSDRAEARPRNATAVFFASWLRSPRKVASIVPSSARLAKAIADQLDPAKPGWIIELGGGTGSVTEGLLARGIPPKRLMVVERDPVMAQFLRERFPEPVLVEGDATNLKQLCERHGVTQANAVVCGLPLIGMPDAISDPITRQALAMLPPDGLFFQYTYSQFSPVDYKRYGLVPNSVRRVLWNIPPASVWSYRFADPERRPEA